MIRSEINLSDPHKSYQSKACNGSSSLCLPRQATVSWDGMTIWVWRSTHGSIVSIFQLFSFAPGNCYEANNSSSLGDLLSVDNLIYTFKPCSLYQAIYRRSSTETIRVLGRVRQPRWYDDSQVPRVQLLTCLVFWYWKCNEFLTEFVFRFCFRVDIGSSCCASTHIHCPVPDIQDKAQESLSSSNLPWNSP